MASPRLVNAMLWGPRRPAVLNPPSPPFRAAILSSGWPKIPPRHVFGHYSSRSIHLSHVVSGSVDYTQQVITSFHHMAGLPWFLTIPAFAMCLSIFPRLFPLRWWQQGILQRQASLEPFLLAWHFKHRGIVSNDKPMSQAEMLAKIRILDRKSKKRIYKNFGVEEWKLYVWIANIPVFLVVSEALRRMCGWHSGLLTALFGTRETAQVQASGPEAGDSAFPNGVASFDAGGEGLASSGSTVADSSLSAGGCLWFENLMAPDPFMILPLLLPVVMLWDVVPRNQSHLKVLLGRSTEEERLGLGLPQWQVRLRRALIVLGCSTPLIAVKVPAAIVLYWVSTFGANILTSAWLHQFRPLRRHQRLLCKPPKNSLDMPN